MTDTSCTTRQILAAVDAAEHSFQSGREMIAGHLRIGSSVSFGRLQIAPRLPAFLKQHGQPQTPQQLSEHNCLLFNLLNSQNLWVYERDEQLHEVRIKGNAQSNNSEAIREMVLGGLGIALSPVWLFSEGLKAGRVIAILREYTAQSLPIQAVSPANRRQSARVKAFVDYMSQALQAAPELQAVK